MKKLNPVFLIPLFCMLFKIGLMAQTPQANLEKYWIYRERLKNYVVSGECQGCGLPAISRQGARSSDPDILSFNDETTMLGIYIGMLACEYKLLHDAGDPFLPQTQNDLHAALQAFNRLDNTAEAWKRVTNGNTGPVLTNGYIYSAGFNPQSGDLNGFFIRDDVSSDFPEVKNFGNRTANLLSNSLVPLDDDYRPKVMNAGLYPKDAGSRCSLATDWPREESLDQVIELLTGLALVVKLVPNDAFGTNYTNAPSEAQLNTFVDEAKIITKRMMDHIVNQNWQIRDPATPNNDGVIGVADGNNCNLTGIIESRLCAPGSQGGGSLFGTEYGFSTAYLEILDNFQQNSADFSTSGIGTLALGAFNYSVGNGDQGVQNGSQEDKFLKLIAVGNTLKGSTMANIDQYAPKADFQPIHTIMLNHVLYPSNTSSFSNNVFECMLNQAYCRGVNSQLPVDYNWGNGAGRVLYGTYPGNLEHPPAILGYAETETNGIDYMYYLGLYSIYNPSYYGAGNFHSIDVKTKLCLRKIAKPDAGSIDNFVENYEKNFYAAETITVGDDDPNATPGNIPVNKTYGISSNSPLAATDPVYRANVTFKAGGQISFMPGFSVDAGAYCNVSIDKTIGTNGCGDTYPQSFTSCLPAACQSSGNELTYTSTEHGIYKVIPISATQMYVATPHQLFKINNTGGGGQDMFNIQQYNTLYGESSSSPYYLFGYQDFSGADYSGNEITDVLYIDNANYSFYNGPPYTIISFKNGEVVKLDGIGGGGDDMFNINHNDGCTSNVYPFCCGSTAYSCYFVGSQAFDDGRYVVKMQYIPQLNPTGALVMFFNDGVSLEINNTGGGGTNMFDVTDPGGNSFAFQDGGLGYYIGDHWFNSQITSYTQMPNSVTIGLQSGKVAKVTRAGGGHQCYFVHEQGGSSGDPFALSPNYDPAHIIGEEWCGAGTANDCFGALSGMFFFGNWANGYNTLAFFDNQYALIAGEGGGGGQSMYHTHIITKGYMGGSLTCSYLEGNTLYAGFSNGHFVSMDVSNNNLTINGSSDFGCKITDFKKINGVYFLCLADGQIIKFSSVGTGPHCFQIASVGHHFETLCGSNYYVGDENFEDINATRKAGPGSTKSSPGGPTGTVAALNTTTGVKSISASGDLSSVSISPNPTSGNFVVSAQNNSFGQLFISVLDGQGRIIKQESTYNIGDEINFSNLEGGVYYLNMRSSVSTITPTVKKLFISK